MAGARNQCSAERQYNQTATNTINCGGHGVKIVQ